MSEYWHGFIVGSLTTFVGFVFLVLILRHRIAARYHRAATDRWAKHAETLWGPPKNNL